MQAQDAFLRISTSFAAQQLVRESDMSVLRGAMWDFLARFSKLDVSATYAEETSLARKDMILEVLPYMQQLVIAYGMVLEPRTLLPMADSSPFNTHPHLFGLRWAPALCSSHVVLCFSPDLSTSETVPMWNIWH